MSKVNIAAALKQIPSRFDLINTAARRAHQLQSQEQKPLIDSYDDKPTIIALKEIASSRINNEIMDNQDRINNLLHQQELKNLDYTFLQSYEENPNENVLHSSFEDTDKKLEEKLRSIKEFITHDN